MDILKSLDTLSDSELFDLVKSIEPIDPAVLLPIASELRRRHLYATEDFVLRLVADIPPKGNA